MVSLWCRGSYTQQEGEGLPDFETDCLLCLLNITGTNWSENRMCSWFSAFNPPDMSLSSCPVYHMLYLVPFTVCSIYPALTLLLQSLGTDWSEFLRQWHPWCSQKRKAALKLRFEAICWKAEAQCCCLAFWTLTGICHQLAGCNRERQRHSPGAVFLCTDQSWKWNTWSSENAKCLLSRM